MMRIDVYLFVYGYAKSREAARKSIEAGFVTVDGKRIQKSSEKIDELAAHSVEYNNVLPYVGRGGLKLEAALDSFSVDPSDAVCIDIGASTGGFTDCLLKRGAARVYAVDSGREQLDPDLRNNEKVVSIESCNARYMNNSIISEMADIIVMDVSFISQTLILPVFPRFLKDSGCAITLVKPQFECGREALGKGGIIKKPSHRLAAVRRVVEAAREHGIYLHGLIKSPIEGGDGNVEYLALFNKNHSYNIESLISNIDYN